MRLNDKSLAEFASSRDAVDKEGFLYKKGELNRGFQKRWFVLKGNLLFYFEKSSDRQPSGVIILEDCNVEVCDITEYYSFSISFTAGTSRTYVLGSESEKTMENWMKAVTLAPYDYTRTIVRELQKRVNKLRTHDIQMSGKDDKPSSGDILSSYDDVDSREKSAANSTTGRGGSHFYDNDVSPSRSTENLSQSYDFLKERKSDSTKNQYPSNDGFRSKTLQGFVRRSKSSENLHAVNPAAARGNSRSPLFKRKSGREFQSIKRIVSDNTKAVTEDDNLGDLMSFDDFPNSSTFKQLHDLYSVSIWTQVKAFEESQSA